MLVTLRTQLSLVLSVLLATSIGATGAILIYESARDGRAELFAQRQLLAENRAFALRDNFLILENELDRLSRLPQIDPSDNNPLPEALLLDNAHRNSTLYTAVLYLSASGDCLEAVPAESGYRNRNFADRPWFSATRAHLSGPQFYPTDEPLVGRTLKIVQPIVRGGSFAGALVGVISLGRDDLITPPLRDGLPQLTEVTLVDNDGRIIFPRVYRAEPGSGWATAIEHATQESSGALRALAHGEDSLFAFASVGASTGYSVVFRWPWRSLVGNLRRQAITLVWILVVGIVVAAAMGLLLAAALTRPLATLGELAVRIGRGEYPPPTAPAPSRSDEIGSLARAFDHMGSSLRERDRALSEAAAKLEQRVDERTRELRAAQNALVEAERFATMGKTSAAIAHELKNAMGGLGMAVDLILQDPNRPGVERLRRQVLAEVTRLRDVTDALLSFSRAPRISPAKDDLSSIVRRAVAMLADTIADRGAEVSLELPPELLLSCDGHKVQGVVMNLVKNAVEAGRHVTVAARVVNGEAVLEIGDDGAGLSEACRKHLFEPFYTEKPNGTGLGLPTSQRFVEAHGGTIEVGTAAAGGALLRVRLPRGDA
jgi:signal transduction histidine kinase